MSGIRDFELKQLLGQGEFGTVAIRLTKVRIIEQISNKKIYALKYMSKFESIKSKSVKNIFRERIILEQLDNPFLISLKYIFQDEEYIYVVMDWAEGGDLEYHLSIVHKMSTNTCKIYAAELASGLAYMHSLNVVHR